jgi:hypothetical protein
LGVVSNQFRLQLLGTTGRRYSIEIRPSLDVGTNWIGFATNRILSNSAVQFADPAPATNSARFYRAKQQ